MSRQTETPVESRGFQDKTKQFVDGSLANVMTNDNVMEPDQAQYISILTKGTNGINNSDEAKNAEALPTIPLADIFKTTYDYDAHFVTYRSKEGENLPRVNKVLLPAIREAGDDLVTDLLVFDYDNPDHAPWADNKAIDEALALLEDKSRVFPLANSWAYFYTTKHGYRLIFRLDTALPVDDAERVHHWFVEEFRSKGILIDPDCSDWTRLFRLPNVVRDGVKTWEEDYYKTETQELTPLKTNTLGRMTKAKKSPSVQTLGIPKPNDDEARALLYTPDGNMTDWYKDVRKHLKTSEHAPILFDHAPLAPMGTRNETIHRLTGYLVAMLYAYSEPEQVYALLYKQCQQLTPDKNTQDWTDELWRSVDKCWGLEQRKEAEKAQQAQEVAEDINGLIPIMRSIHKGIPANDDEALIWIEEHCIVRHGSLCSLLKQDGYYGPLTVDKEDIRKTLKKSWLSDVIPFTYTDKRDQEREITDANLLKKHGYKANTVFGIPNTLGGILKEYANGQTRDLYIPTFQRKPDSFAEYSPEVDEWLQRFGERNYEGACGWISMALDFSGLVPALSIVADQGIGKKMLLKGLSECLENDPNPADASELVSDFQKNLFYTPFLPFNEGCPNHPRIIDEFRKFVSGDGISVNRKNKDPIDVKVRGRVVITANNNKVVKKLTGGATSYEDEEAVKVRAFHFRATKTAQLWLKSKGGYDFTDGWVEGEGGEQSDYVVAKHFMWLYVNRNFFGIPRDRFLFPGHVGYDTEDPFGSSSLDKNGKRLAAFIAENYEKAQGGQARKAGGMDDPWACVKDDKIFVNSTNLDKTISGLDDKIDTGKQGTGVFLKDRFVLPENMDATNKNLDGTGRKRWWELDMHRLAEIAFSEGCVLSDLLKPFVEGKTQRTKEWIEPRKQSPEEALERIRKEFTQ